MICEEEVGVHVYSAVRCRYLILFYFTFVVFDIVVLASFILGTPMQVGFSSSFKWHVLNKGYNRESGVL